MLESLKEMKSLMLGGEVEGDDGRRCWICFLKKTKQLFLRSQQLLVFVLKKRAQVLELEEQPPKKQENLTEVMKWNEKEKKEMRLQEEQRPEKEEKKWKG